MVVPVAQIAASGPHPVTSGSSSSNFGATGFISLSCLVSGFRVGAMTCVTAGCASACANAFRPFNPVAPRIRTFMPNTSLSCELSQMIIHVNLQELAPLFWRHLAEHRMRLPVIGSPRVPGGLQDFQQLCLFVRELESLRMRDFEARRKA